MDTRRHGPPGWPETVPPPGVDGWQDVATEWLLEHCPADYHLYDGWRRHPVALAWIATRHIHGQVTVMREAYRNARVDLGQHLSAEALRQVLDVIEREGLRLRAAARAAHLISMAMSGVSWPPRL